jgi:predicted KAP-like P-loop ATPase
MGLSEDRPINRLDEDRLHRRAFAEQVASYIHSAPAGHGLVVSAMAPWGNGKTSFMNMVVDELGKTGELVVRFNPWMFSGTEQLVARLLGEIRSVLLSAHEKRYDTAAEALGRYGDALALAGDIPIVGAAAKAGRLALLAGRRATEHKRKISGETPRKVRDAIDQALRTGDRRIVVVIDDVDRLDDQEIREVVRLVRLVADFPNTVYLLAFDRARVEAALGPDGAAYLEKIVQLPIDLPAISPDDLLSLLFQELDAAIADLPTGPFDSSEWQNVFGLALRPLFRSLRDVRRYVNAVPLAVLSVGTEVSLTDVLALEALRVLLPTTYARLVAAAGALTYVGSGLEDVFGPETRKAMHQAAMNDALEAGQNSENVKAFCRIVFPASRRFFENYHFGPDFAQRWRRERRVANAEILGIYLSRRIPEDAPPPSEIALMFEALPEPSRLSQLFAALSPEQVENSLGLLEAYEEEFTTASAAALPVILDQLPRLRTGRGGRFGWGAEMAVYRLVLRIVRRLPETERLAAVKTAFETTTSLSAKLALIQVVGPEENIGSSLIAEGDWRPLATELRSEIVAADAEALATERDLGRLVGWAVDGGGDGDRRVPQAILDDDLAFVQLLRSMLGEQFSQTVGEIARRREAVLPWDWLGKLLGADTLLARVASSAGRDNLKPDERAAEALALAVRYASGWRPERYPGAKTEADPPVDDEASNPGLEP